MTELFIEGYQIDLQGVEIPLNFSVSDIREPEKRKNTYSKTVRLPGTENNNQAFAWAYNLQRAVLEGAQNISYTFNRKKRASFRLLEDGQTILTGTARLTAAEIRGGKIEYHVLLYAEVTNLFNEIGVRELRDLDGTEIEHQYTIENIIASWECGGSGSDPYVYPVIDYGEVNTRMQTATMSTLRPAIRAKWYWDQIFEEAGFTYSGDIAEDDIFVRLIIPFSGDKIERLVDFPITQVSNEQLVVEDDTPYSPYAIITEDPEDYYDIESKEYNVPSTERYDISWLVPLRLTFTPDNGDAANAGQQVYNKFMTIRTRLMVNDVEVQSRGFIIGSFDYFEQFDGQGFITARSREYIMDGFFDGVELNEGDVVRLEVFHDYDAVNPFFNQASVDDWPGTISVEWNEGTSVTVFEQERIEGSVLTLPQIAPDMTQKDFLTGIIRMFNLYLVPNGDRHINVYKRDEFYDEGGERDWTDLLAVDKPIKNTNISETLVKALQYKYKHDEDDWYLSIYKERWGREYGELRLDTGYEFSSEIKDVLNLPFGTVIPIGYRSGPQAGEFAIEVDEDNPSVIQVQGLKAADPNYTNIPSLPKFERAYIGRQVEILGETFTISDMISPWRMQLATTVPSNLQSPTPSGYRVFNASFRYVGGGSDKVVPAIVESNDNGLTFQPFESIPRICAFCQVQGSQAWTIQQTPILRDGSPFYRFKESITKSVTVEQYPIVSHVLGSPSEPVYDLLFAQPFSINWTIGLVYLVDEDNNNVIDEDDNLIIG